MTTCVEPVKSVKELGALAKAQIGALAVASLRRSSAAPELPTVAESGYPGFEISAWYHHLLQSPRYFPTLS